MARYTDAAALIQAAAYMYASSNSQYLSKSEWKVLARRYTKFSTCNQTSIAAIFSPLVNRVDATSNNTVRVEHHTNGRIRNVHHDMPRWVGCRHCASNSRTNIALWRVVWAIKPVFHAEHNYTQM
jgi:hypothetical protein